MKNIQMTTKGTELTLVMDLTQEFGVSSSGKSIIIASSEGNQSIAGHTAKVGVNLYRGTTSEKSLEGTLNTVLGNNIAGSLSKDGKTLTLKVDLTKEGALSASGKSKSVASTGGNISIGLGALKLGVNVYNPVK